MKRKRSKTKPSPRGSDKAQRHRFAIKLMRPIFQTAVITVDAASEEHAVRLAFRKASRLKEEEWVGSFDARKYRYDLQNVLDATEFSDEATETSVTAADFAKDLCEMHITEYLLLKADIEGGQGEAVNQPWLTRRATCSWLMWRATGSQTLRFWRKKGARDICAGAGAAMSFRFGAR